MTLACNPTIEIYKMRLFYLSTESILRCAQADLTHCYSAVTMNQLSADCATNEKQLVPKLSTGLPSNVARCAWQASCNSSPSAPASSLRHALGITTR